MGIGVAIVTAISSALAATTVGTVIAIGIEVAISYGVNALLASKAKKGGGGVAERAGRTENIRSNTAPHNAVYGACRKGGLIFYYNGTGTNNEYLHLGIAVAAHQVEKISDINFNGELVAITSSSGNLDAGQTLTDYARVQHSLGSENQPSIEDMGSENPNWTSEHRARGHAYLYARLRYNQAKYPSFIPKITARMLGQNQIFDPRDQLTKYTDNPALCLADVMERYLKIPRSRIDSGHLIEAANICDQTLTRNDSIIEKRYTCGGFFELEGEPSDWLQPFLTAMAGNVTEFGGIYYISAGAFKASELTITDDDITSGIKYRTAESDYSRSNSAKGVFVGIDSFDQPTDFPAIKNDTYITEDGGTINWLELDLEFVPSHTQAQRVANIMLNQSRQDETVSFSLSLEKGLDIKPWDTVTLNLEAIGLTGTWQVISHSINVDSPMSVDISLKRHTVEVYAWNAATQEKPLIFNSTNNEGGAQSAIATNVVLNIESKISEDAHFTFSVNCTFTQPTINFSRLELAFRVEYEYRVRGSAGAWVITAKTVTLANNPSFGDPANIITDDCVIPFLSDSAGYEFRNFKLLSPRMKTYITPTVETTYKAIANSQISSIAKLRNVTSTKGAQTTGSNQSPLLGTISYSWLAPVVPVASFAVEGQITVEYREQGSLVDWKKITKNVTISTLSTSNSTGTIISFFGGAADGFEASKNYNFRNFEIAFSRVRSNVSSEVSTEWINA